jgi:hypothetical protein
MELISKEINGVIVYTNPNDGSWSSFETLFIPKIAFDKEVNKWRWDGLDGWGDQLILYFDSVAGIVQFLGLDIEEDK